MKSTHVTKSFIVFCLTALLVGCSHIKNRPGAPFPQNVALPNSEQARLESSAQWQVVADDLANRWMGLIKEKNLKPKPLYVQFQNKPSAFSRAFNDFLLTSLVQKGVQVSQKKEGSRVVNYKVQLLEYQSTRSTLLSDQVKFTSLGGGLVVLRNVGNFFDKLLKSSTVNDLTILGAGVALDSIDANIAPNTEIIITSSLLDNAVFVGRTSDIYYVNGSDRQLYRPVPTSRGAETFDDPFYQFK